MESLDTFPTFNRCRTLTEIDCHLSSLLAQSYICEDVGFLCFKFLWDELRSSSVIHSQHNDPLAECLVDKARLCDLRETTYNIIIYCGLIMTQVCFHYATVNNNKDFTSFLP